MTRQEDVHRKDEPEDDEEPEFAPPPNTSGYDGASLRCGARIPCTRDDNHEQTDPDAGAVWALALGLAIARHGAHWARSFARAIVRLHINEGWLEVFLDELDEPISARLDVDDVFACFTEARKTIAIEEDSARWRDEQAVTLYAWDIASADDYHGRWCVERDAMRSDRVAASTAGRKAIEAAHESAEGYMHDHGSDVHPNELLAHELRYRSHRVRRRLHRGEEHPPLARAGSRGAHRDRHPRRAVAQSAPQGHREDAARSAR